MMTEAEWLTSANSYEMLNRCRRTVQRHPRKGRLFAVASCQRIWHLLTDPRSRAAVEAAALYAEGVIDDDQLRAAAEGAKEAHTEAFSVKGKIGASAE